MTHKISKGNHRGRPLKFGIWYSKKYLKKRITFTEESKYPFATIGVHKLFGIGYFWSHHTDSARFGWKYNGDKFQLFAYCYVNKKRIMQLICSVPIDTPVDCELHIINSMYVFKVQYNSAPVSIVQLKFDHNKKFAFPLGLYFGGISKAPNDIKIQME